jgi:hypothetical protein
MGQSYTGVLALLKNNKYIFDTGSSFSCRLRCEFTPGSIQFTLHFPVLCSAITHLLNILVHF